MVVVGDQASRVFLGDYSGTPSEQISLRQALGQALPRARVLYDAAGSSTTSTEPPSLAPATQSAIRAADLVVVMVGTDSDVGGEGYDRRSLSLPGNYQALIKQVAALGNPRSP